MTKKHFLSVLILILCATKIHAQALGSTYKTAVGVKFYPAGISVKHFTKPNVALEGIAYFWPRGSRFTGLYEFHGNIENAKGLKWYAGPGAHIGLYRNRYYGGGTSIGVDGVLGLDYKIKSVPFNVSLDWQPSFEFGNYAGFDGDFGGFAIRYTLK